MNTESFKGKPCYIKPITCQEGYCQDCAIYQNREKPFWYRKELDDWNSMRGREWRRGLKRDDIQELQMEDKRLLLKLGGENA